MTTNETPESSKAELDRSELQDLVERAVRNAKPRRAGVLVQRWIAVKEVFAVGRTRAEDLCHRYGLDPEEMIPSIGELHEIDKV